VSELVDRADELLKAVAASADAIGNRPLTLHWPTIGSAFDRGVLVVGQAVFGWMGNWSAQEARDSAIRGQIIADAQNPFPDLTDPMAWIDGHRVRTSPFWSVARQVTDAVTPGEAPWFSRVAWANLYPVAPNDVKANPAGALLQVQTDPAAQFLSTLIADIEPRFVLVVGGPYVWPFVELLRLETLEHASPPLYRVSRHGGSRWIIGMHPGGASRRGWGPTKYSELLISAARTLDEAPSE